MKNQETITTQPDPESPEDVSRRIFMARVIAGLGLGTTAVLGINIGRYFISPIWEKRTDDFIALCSLESLQTGKPLKIDYVQRKKDGWEIREIPDSMWLIREDDNRVTAFNKSCTHLGCALDWKEDGKEFKCPCHKASFSIYGKRLSGPPERDLDYFTVKVENGIVLVKPETIKGEKI